ncbi:hypothetical protein LZC95_04880 [Pendulispora brunnea]|uniref:Uncharacterized protein n=1 Tax=Pendulispora brunnea TaxID=2905690 RepID=A0ABZ2KIJ3_9BACT
MSTTSQMHFRFGSMLPWMLSTAFNTHHVDNDLATSADFVGTYNAERPRMFERRALAMLFVLGSIAAAAPAAAQPDPRSTDAIFTQAAAVPQAGIVRVGAIGSIERERAENESSTAAIETRMLWSIDGRFAAQISMYSSEPLSYPAVQLRRQWVSQDRSGVDLMSTITYRGLGPEAAGGQVETALALGRVFGPVLLMSNAAIGKGVGSRNDVDFAASAVATVRLVGTLQLGAEARARTELMDEYKTDEDTGRPFQLQGGGLASVRYERIVLQGLVAWNSPRGSARPGPMALASASIDF